MASLLWMAFYSIKEVNSVLRMCLLPQELNNTIFSLKGPKESGQ